ncbi:TPA: hypothetical protein DHW58_02195 [Patescibacteria group bacterium]|uniref:Uncharacterized protein n=2 Tax=Bacteria division Kazan-3B-28 TaxID=1798534 RepID=A0A0G2A3L3_UNCK3|nr:MAG: hypothetical protein VE98_C0001G0257 [candidate division Kazan bacterium GW2011_GWA1_50_15]KKW25468.1 MAG: hypothetical protein VE99_C0001G0105 [candidate division Kazan bacterium GW2011_GWC1_52_13]KKW26774.1 MAG: hypothetical protein VF00_C0002G0099 [candidate division Kazan bacterium GW2011_GWB1_52_7]HAV65769.1 hypothetical protein [Patescibacteria group bacterium]HCL47779.1 hypothetical protein [Patescibacteria group bacterium]
MGKKGNGKSSKNHRGKGLHDVGKINGNGNEQPPNKALERVNRSASRRGPHNPGDYRSPRGG